jgi:signal transduction histidine kinase/ligand-binding sensor domain-containing protein/DNA-binding response OmpR family regulator
LLAPYFTRIQLAEVRKRGRLHLFVKLLCFFCVPLSLVAAPSPVPSLLGIEQGLSNNTVRSIFQDHNGLMWLGTFDGLNRYDGYDCKVFRNRKNDSNSLVHNIILSLTEDSLHYLWIGTRQGVSRLEPLVNRFTTIRFAAGRQPFHGVAKDIKCDHTGNIYIATEGTGLLCCQQGSTFAQTIPLVRSGASITQYSVKSIRVDKAGQVWVLVPKYGLARYDQKQQQLLLVNEELNDAVWMELNGGHLLIASGYRLLDYDPLTNNYTLALDYKAQQPTAGSIVTFALDREGRCWIGTVLANLLVWKVGEAPQIITDNRDNQLLNTIGLHTLYIDRQSRKWIGTARGGAMIIDPQKGRFLTLTHELGNENSLIDNEVSSIYEAPDGKLYIGTDGGGVSIWDRTSNRFTALRNDPNNAGSLSDNAIVGIRADQLGDIWITTFRQGVNRYHPATGKIDRFMPVNPASTTLDRVSYGLLIDRHQEIWVSTLRQNSIYGALYRFNRMANRFELFDAGLSDLFTLYEDSKGELWGGDLHQLVKIDRTGKKHLRYEIGYAVRCIFEDRSGHLWIGTEGGGLLLFDRNKGAVTASYTINEGLNSDVVLTILQDGNGQLWLSTFNGLSKFDPLTRRFKNYDQGDGLQSNQFHYNSALQLRSGELAFGGIKGLSIFQPTIIRAEHAMPSLQLSGLTINNIPIEQAPEFIRKISEGAIASITVPYSKAVLGFRFTALEYSVPAKINYAYYMEGWDRGWNYSGDIRTAMYTHLSEGNYIFRVKSTNGEGEWNPQELAIRIKVLPPWYRSWWAYILYGTCLAAAIYLFISYKTRQSRLHYEVKVAQLQTKEAQLNAQKEKEVHEKRLTFFTNLSHEFRTPLTLIIDPLKEMIEQEKEPAQKEGLHMVFRNARRLLSLVDQLMLFRKAETAADRLHLTLLNATELCREVFYSFVQQARIKKLDYRFECAQEVTELCADREKLEIILFNLLSNAIKFTPAGGTVVLKLSTTDTLVNIEVSDSGVGIPAAAGDKLFNRFYQVKDSSTAGKTGFGIGLFLVKHFTTLHHGQVTYQSEVNEGTSFFLSLLKGTAHFSGQQIDREEQPAAAVIPVPMQEEAADAADKGRELSTLVTEKPSLLIVDDDDDLRNYIIKVFSNEFTILQAVNGRKGLTLAQQHLPDLIISDIAMEEMGGVELCKQVKEDPALSHIPVILLTASTASETRLQGIEAGADDYITKPFEKELLKARVVSLLKKRNSLQQYFYNEITLQQNDGKVSVEYREFLEKCIRIVEEHLDDETFSIKTLTIEMGMSRSSLYRKVNSVSGQSIIGFIRFIRLRKAAGLMIDTENNITEIASMTGFNDIKYFRAQFSQLFGMNPSEYIRRFRKPFHNKLQINKNIRKPE